MRPAPHGTSAPHTRECRAPGPRHGGPPYLFGEAMDSMADFEAWVLAAPGVPTGSASLCLTSILSPLLSLAQWCPTQVWLYRASASQKHCGVAVSTHTPV